MAELRGERAGGPAKSELQAPQIAACPSNSKWLGAAGQTGSASLGGKS